MKPKVRIGASPETNFFEIYFYDESGGRSAIAKPVELVFHHVEVGEKVEPTLKIPMHFAKEFSRALAKALEKEGIEGESTCHLKKLLTAKEAHLEDLRKVLFEKHPKIVWKT